ncbi:hypothetical protein ACKUFS_26620 [Pseudomonas cannabina]|uniref:Uncharacterized protein n=1 Tax=Pseudomonas syringae pv. maculicola str. ES4326 TaxID=629265 RepID=A0A8T8BWW0_PSEYM|nr:MULTISPECIES: hypothetical protein [Pseudomonas syringae group]QHE95607.1 hypothetical protein PMA4326_002480 [Pseudomonas syringae pv. maculicola str. ES4326]QQN22797.1 hypothetical protein JGS08_03640 [Pseudomonas cannabina pv. alisalensis]UBY96233.1 hypothetical protein LCG56_19890 [Pseudomonas cannabina pv. alisalensis]
MPHNTMTFQEAVRPGSSSNGCTSVARSYADFQIDECSLLEILVTADGGNSDYMSGFVSGYLEQSLQFADNLIRCDQPQAEPCRVAIYICPECGDIGCGAYSVQIRSFGSEIIWEEFAYENGYEEPRIIADVGPFIFSSAPYVRAVKAVSEI